MAKYGMETKVEAPVIPTFSACLHVPVTVLSAIRNSGLDRGLWISLDLNLHLDQGGLDRERDGNSEGYPDHPGPDHHAVDPRL